MASRMNLNVLVADDSRAVHSVFAEIAQRSPIPFNVIVAQDGRECMDVLSRGSINIAFIDVNMPEMSGMEAVRQARHIGDKTFVTLMSADANPRRMQLAQQLKVYDFLAKPFTYDDVLTILKTYSRVTAPCAALVVDDSATVRRIIKKVLTDSIFRIDVTEAADGETAIDCCDSGKFDVVFLDCNIPGLGGMNTLEHLLERNPAVNAIMISGERNEERRRQALERGATAFLYKPFNASIIDRELHAMFGLHMPQLSRIEPLQFGRVTGASVEPDAASWT